MTNKMGLVYCGAALFSLFVGFSFLAVKVAITAATTFEVLTFRFTFGFIAIAILILFKVIKINLKGKSIKNLVIASLFYTIGFFTLQTIGLKYATSVEGGIIFAIIPVFTMLLASFFLKEETNWKQKICVIISVFGVIYLFMMGGDAFNLSYAKGIIILCLSSLSVAVYNVQTRWLRKEFNPIEISFGMLLIGCVFYNALLIGISLINGDLMNYFSILKNTRFLISVMYLGVFTTFFSSVLMAFVLSKLETIKMSVFGNLSTVVSIVVGVIIMKEPVHLYHLIGSVLIIFGVIGTNLFSKKQVEIENNDGQIETK